MVALREQDRAGHSCTVEMLPGLELEHPKTDATCNSSVLLWHDNTVHDHVMFQEWTSITDF
jgi:hypothetical protein